MAEEKQTQTKILYPTIKQPPVLWKNTQTVFKKISKLLGGPIISYFVGSHSFMHKEDVKYFYPHVKQMRPQDTLYFILVSNGGSGESAWRIASLLKNYCKKLVIVLPEVAESAATILSLAADEIIMTPIAYLTPVDTSIYHPLNPRDTEGNAIHVELDEVNRSIQALKDSDKTIQAIDIYKTIFQYIHPVAFGAIARSTNLTEMLCSDIMDLRNNKPSPAFKKKIINELNTNYPSHTYPIPRHKAKKLGLDVTFSTPELDDLLGSLLSLYVQITRTMTTYIDEYTIHTETVDGIIETKNMRYALHHTRRKRLDRILRNWTTVKNEYAWISYFTREEGGRRMMRQTQIDF